MSKNKIIFSKLVIQLGMSIKVRVKYYLKKKYQLAKVI